MTKAFHVWSPRTRPLEYDSLQSDVGCQDTPAGSQLHSSKPFNRICIAEHDADTDSIYNRLDTVGYATGPAFSGDAFPWDARWAAWVASAGVRVKRTAFVTPPANAIGDPAPFFSTTIPTKVTIGFTAAGQLALAIQKTAATITVKWVDNLGVVQTMDVLGSSPLLFQNGLLSVSDDENESDLVLYYLRPEVTRTIFARFEREGFITEYVVNDNLQTNLTRLIAMESEGGKQVLYARDAIGRDIILRSDAYPVEIDGDAATLSPSVAALRYSETAIAVIPPVDRASLTLSISSLIYGSPIVETSALPEDAANLSVAIIFLEYQ